MPNETLVKDFDWTSAVPVAELEPEGGGISRSNALDFDFNSARPVPDETISEMLISNVKEAGLETVEEVLKVASVIRWPFWRFVEHPLSTIVTSLQEPENKTVGDTLSRAAQTYIPFRRIPKEEVGTYGQIWNNYFKSITKQDAPDWYLAMASYGSAVAFEIPAIEVAVRGGELAFTRVAKPFEADIIRKLFDPLKNSLSKAGVDSTKLHAVGNIIKLSDKSEVFMNKYVSAVLRGDKIRIPRWAKIKKLPVPTAKVIEKGLVPTAPEILPITGSEVIIPMPKPDEEPKPPEVAEIPLEQAIREDIEAEGIPEVAPAEIPPISKDIVAEKLIRKEALTEEEITQFPDLAKIEKQLTSLSEKEKLSKSEQIQFTSILGQIGVTEKEFRKIKPAPAAKKILGIKEEKITVTPKQALKERFQTLARGIKEGIVKTKKDIKETQTSLINLIEESGLIPQDKAKFIRTLKNVQTQEQLQKALPEIEERIGKLVEKQEKIGLVKEISRFGRVKVDVD